MAGDPFRQLAPGESLESGTGPFSAEWHNAMTAARHDVQRLKQEMSAEAATFPRREVLHIANVSGSALVRGGITGLGAICIINYKELVIYSAAPADDAAFAVLLEPIPANPYYVSLVADNVDVAPPDRTATNWLTVQGSITPSAWSVVTAYVRGNLVTQSGSTYVCIKDHTNQQPPNATYWLALTSGVTNTGGYRHTKIYALGDLVILPAIGRAMLAGSVRANIDITSVSHVYAGPVDGDYDALASQSAGGPARILAAAPENAALNGGITSAVTTVVVENATAWPDEPFVVTVDSEDMNVTAVSGTTSWTVTRGYNGTTAASHSDGAAVAFKSGTVLADVVIDNGAGAFGTAGGDLAGTYPDPTVRRSSTEFALTADITPSQITSDQNNYNPTGLSTASTLRLSSDAARNITGLAGGADGRLLLVHNVGSFAITLKDESASSTAANRFASAGDFVLQSDTAVLLQYDGTSSRWRVFGQPSITSINGMTGPAITVQYGTDVSATADAIQVAALSNTITLSARYADSTRSGIVQASGSQVFNIDADFLTVDAGTMVTAADTNFADCHVTDDLDVGDDATVHGDLTSATLRVDANAGSGSTRRHVTIGSGTDSDFNTSINGFDPTGLANGSGFLFRDNRIYLYGVLSSSVTSTSRYGINHGGVYYEGEDNTTFAGKTIRGGLVIEGGTFLATVPEGGTARSSLTSGQLIAGAGTSAVDSLAETRVSGDALELKIGTDAWTGFSSASF